MRDYRKGWHEDREIIPPKNPEEAFGLLCHALDRWYFPYSATLDRHQDHDPRADLLDRTLSEFISRNAGEFYEYCLDTARLKWMCKTRTRNNGRYRPEIIPLTEGRETLLSTWLRQGALIEGYLLWRTFNAFPPELLLTLVLTANAIRMAASPRMADSFWRIGTPNVLWHLAQRTPSETIRVWRDRHENLASPQRWDALLLMSHSAEVDARFEGKRAPRKLHPRLPTILPDDQTLSAMSAGEIVSYLDAYMGTDRTGAFRNSVREFYRDKGSVIRKNAQTLCHLGVSRFQLAETLECAMDSGYPVELSRWSNKPPWLEVFYEVFGAVSVTPFHDDFLCEVTNEAWSGGNVYLIDTRVYPMPRGLGYSDGLTYLYSTKLKDQVPYINPILPYLIRRACFFGHSGIGASPEELCRILGLLDR